MTSFGNFILRNCMQTIHLLTPQLLAFEMIVNNMIAKSDFKIVLIVIVSYVED